MTCLLLIPHAGGAAHSYTPLKRVLDGRMRAIPYELPGRGRRKQDSPVASMQAAIEDLLGSVAQLGGQPWSVFGHSMGALLAHDLVSAIPTTGLPLPQALFVSGTTAPGGTPLAPISHFPKPLFWRRIRAYGGVPDEVLQLPDLLDYMEPFLRQDFGLIERQVFSEVPALPVPIVALFGTDDMTAQQAGTWAGRTSVSFEQHAFEGHHFYLQHHVPAVAAVIDRTLVRLGALPALPDA